MTRFGRNNNLSNFNRSVIAWFIIYIAIGLAISVTVPFPLSLILYVGIYLLLQTHRIQSIEKKHNHSNKTNNPMKNKGLLKRFIYSLWERSFHILDLNIRPYCMNCGQEHKSKTCPLCGSKAVRVG